MSEFTDGLRQLADFYDHRPDLPTPVAPTVSVYAFTAEELDRFTELAEATPIKLGSEYVGTGREFGPVRLTIFTRAVPAEAEALAS